MSQGLYGRLLVALTAFAVLLVAAPLAFAYGDRDGSSYGGYDGGYNDGGGYGDRGDDYKYATIKDDNKLVVFDRDGNKRQYQINRNGIPVNQDFVGIDVRPTGPKAGGLYGLTRNGNVFVIDPRNGAARFVSRLNVALVGNSFGVDFNPEVDRLRVISDQDQNLRANVDTGATLVDGRIRYAQGDRNQGRNPVATGAGYTYAPFSTQTPPPGDTTLYDIETGSDFLTVQAPPNNGTLNSVGSLNRNVGPRVGFDVAGKDDYDGYGLFQEGSRARLYEVDLRDGDTDPKGVALYGYNYDGLAVLNGYEDRYGDGGYGR